eukprot:UN02442
MHIHYHYTKVFSPNFGNISTSRLKCLYFNDMPIIIQDIAKSYVLRE